MRVGIILGLLMLFTDTVGAQKKLPRPNPPAPKPDNAGYTGPKVENGVAVLLDENIKPLIGAIFLSTGGKHPANSLEVERNDVFAGLESLKQTGQELHAGKVPGWDFQFVEKPTKPNEFRYMRFAWKKADGGSILLAFPQNGGWAGKRYSAGPYALGSSGLKVADDAPKEWTIVTRDVFKDFGSLHCSGILFSSTGTGVTHWDLLLLGKTVEDLDLYTEAAIGKGKPKEPLIGKLRDDAWADLMGDDRTKASAAFRTFLPVAADQVEYIRAHIPKPVQPDEELPKRIRSLIARLGGDDFDDRRAAEAELEKIGPKAGPQLKDARNGPNPETQYRARRLLAKLGVQLDDVPPGQQRAARITRLLGQANTPDARELLKKMAAGDFGPDFPSEATAALARLPKK